MEINFFNSEKILRLTPITKETKEIADEIVEGNVRVFPKLANVKVQGVSELWEMKFESSPSTYALYVYALYPLSYLLNAYELTGGEGYLDRAVSLALDFLDWEEGDKKQINKKRSKILFGDHAVSNRTQALCYLLCCLKNASREVPEELMVALIRNGEYLANSKNYSHYNHGLMMDLALLGLLNTLEGLEIEHPPHLKEILMARLQHSITRDLTEDGVHVENSPGYHFWMLGFLERITPALQNFDKHLFFKVKEVMKKATEYAEYITRPDGSVPAVGDTHAGVKYKPKKGLGSKFFQHANQVIFRSPRDDVWAHLICGYKTHVHKHSDNGAFSLNYKGEDLLIDPGFLNYENSEDSMLIKSASFHSTACPQGEDQEIERIEITGEVKNYDKNVGLSRISRFVQTINIESAFAVISDYVNSLVERLVVWLKPDTFIIFDVIRGHSDALEQFYHIAPGLTVDAVGENEVKLFSGDSLQCTITAVSVEGLKPVSYELEVLSGYVASSFNNKVASTRIKMTSKQGYACALIRLGDGVDKEVSVDFLRKEILEKMKLDVAC